MISSDPHTRSARPRVALRPEYRASARLRRVDLRRCGLRQLSGCRGDAGVAAGLCMGVAE
jgi:hypothetical protein